MPCSWPCVHGFMPFPTCAIICYMPFFVDYDQDRPISLCPLESWGVNGHQGTVFHTKTSISQGRLHGFFEEHSVRSIKHRVVLRDSLVTWCWYPIISEFLIPCVTLPAFEVRNDIPASSKSNWPCSSAQRWSWRKHGPSNSGRTISCQEMQAFV